MAGFTNPQAEIVLKHLLGVQSWTMPTALYGLLGTNATTPDDTGAIALWTEPATANAYARIGCDSEAGWVFSAQSATTFQAKNGTQLEYAQATTGDWGTIAYFGLSTTATRAAGVVFMWGAMAQSKEILVGDQAIFASNGITIALG